MYTPNFMVTEIQVTVLYLVLTNDVTPGSMVMDHVVTGEMTHGLRGQRIKQYDPLLMTLVNR